MSNLYRKKPVVVEAVLAERDALKAELVDYKDAAASEADFVNEQAEKIRELKAERDALAAHLAPVDDDILREIAAMHFARIDGHSDNWDRYVDEAKDYIDAIRPHIEAAERERCAKVADKQGWCAGSAVVCGPEIAAAIRSGK